MPSSRKETAAADITAFAAGAGPPEKIIPTRLIEFVLHAHALFNNAPLILKGSVEWDYSGIGLII